MEKRTQNISWTWKKGIIITYIKKLIGKKNNEEMTTLQDIIEEENVSMKTFIHFVKNNSVYSEIDDYFLNTPHIPQMMMIGCYVIRNLLLQNVPKHLNS